MEVRLMPVTDHLLPNGVSLFGGHTRGFDESLGAIGDAHLRVRQWQAPRSPRDQTSDQPARETVVQTKELRGLVRRVAGEQVVRGLAAEHDPNVAARLLGSEVECNSRGMCVGFVEMTDDFREDVTAGRVDKDLLVSGAETQRHQPCGIGFIVAAAVESGCVGSDVRAPEFVQGGQDGARVQTAAEEHPDSARLRSHSVNRALEE